MREQLRVYEKTQAELLEAFAAWGNAHPDVYVDFKLPAKAEVIGSLWQMPQEWCGNEAARELLLYCVGRVPGATIAMFRTCCIKAASLPGASRHQ